MLCIWMHNFGPERISDDLRLTLYQTLSTKCPSSIFFGMTELCYCSFLFVVFCFVFVLMLTLELCRCSSDRVMSSRSRTGFTTTYITDNRDDPPIPRWNESMRAE